MSQRRVLATTSLRVQALEDVLLREEVRGRHLLHTGHSCMRLVVVVHFALVLHRFEVEELCWVLQREVVDLVLCSCLFLLQVLLELLLALPVKGQGCPQPVLSLVRLLVLAKGSHQCSLGITISGAVGLHR